MGGGFGFCELGAGAPPCDVVLKVVFDENEKKYKENPWWGKWGGAVVGGWRLGLGVGGGVRVAQQDLDPNEQGSFPSPRKRDHRLPPKPEPGRKLEVSMQVNQTFTDLMLLDLVVIPSVLGMAFGCFFRRTKKTKNDLAVLANAALVDEGFLLEDAVQIRNCCYICQTCECVKTDPSKCRVSFVPLSACGPKNGSNLTCVGPHKSATRCNPEASQL